MNPLLYAKLAAVLALGAALAYGGYHVADLKGKAALASLQHAWDVDKAEIQKVTDKAIEKATKDKEDAIAANEVINDEYQKKLNGVTADSDRFASLLRNAAITIAAHRSAMQQASNIAGSAQTRTEAITVQLGQLVALTTDLRAECIKNDDELDALTSELNSQL